MGIRAALFDYGNTLVSTRLNWERIVPISLGDLRQALQAAGLQADWDRLGQDFLRLRKLGKKKAEREWVETKAVDSLRSALALQNIEAVDDMVLQQGVDAFFREEEQTYPVIAGVVESLTQLKSMGLRLGVVSNATCGQLIRRSLGNRNLLNWFDTVVVSADVGVCKPDPSIVQVALNALDIVAEEACLIGDRLDTDIAGAKRSHMKGVLADYFGEHPTLMPHTAMPEATIRKPLELVAILRDWM